MSSCRTTPGIVESSLSKTYVPGAAVAAATRACLVRLDGIHASLRRSSSTFLVPVILEIPVINNSSFTTSLSTSVLEDGLKIDAEKKKHKLGN